MKKTFTFLSAAIVAGAVGGSAIGESHVDKAIMAAIKARQAHMTLYAFNIGLLGGMAKGAIPYDADAASKAAANLDALAHTDQSRMWPPGSDSFELSEDITAAKPEIWSDGGKIMEKIKALDEATVSMAKAAGGGLDSLKAAIGPLGEACGSCHKAYRISKN